MSKKHEPMTTAEAEDIIVRAADNITAQRNNSHLPAVISRDTPITECPTSLDVTTRKGKALALAAMSPTDIAFGQDGLCRFVAVDWIIFPDERIDNDTGEISEFTRIVFFNADGQTFRTTAAHGPKRLKAMLQLFTREEWQQGLPLVIRERKNQAGTRTYHDIRVDY